VLPAADHVAEQLKWLSDLLGAVRDAEVLAEHLRASFAQLPGEVMPGPTPEQVTERFASQRAAARAELLAALDSARYLDLLDALDALVASPLVTPAAGQPARSVMPRAVRRPYRRAGRWMARAARAPDEATRDSALHQARKAAKRARYGAEAASLALGSDARRFGRRMKALQSVLGDHQDTVIARAAITELAAAAWQAGNNSFSYGIAYQVDADAAFRHRERARQVWQKATRPGIRRWLD